MGCGCALALNCAVSLVEFSVVASRAPLSVWLAKQFAALSGGVEGVLVCGDPAACILASVELAVVASVVALAALVSELWSLSWQRRAALPYPLREELPLEEAASDVQCAVA